MEVKEVKELVVVEVITAVRHLKYLVNVHLLETDDKKATIPAAIEMLFNKLPKSLVIKKVSAYYADYDSLIAINKIVELIINHSNVVLIESINIAND